MGIRENVDRQARARAAAAYNPNARMLMGSELQALLDEFVELAQERGLRPSALPAYSGYFQSGGGGNPTVYRSKIQGWEIGTKGGGGHLGVSVDAQLMELRMDARLGLAPG